MLRAALLVVVVALLAASAATAALTPSQYRMKATAICKTTSAKLEALGSPKNRDDLLPLFKKALPIFRGQVSKLKALSPPASLRALHVKALALEKQQIDGIQQFVDQVDDGADLEQTYKALDARLTKVSDAESATWKKLRLPACADL